MSNDKSLARCFKTICHKDGCKALEEAKDIMWFPFKFITLTLEYSSKNLTVFSLCILLKVGEKLNSFIVLSKGVDPSLRVTFKSAPFSKKNFMTLMFVFFTKLEKEQARFRGESLFIKFVKLTSAP